MFSLFKQLQFKISSFYFIAPMLSVLWQNIKLLESAGRHLLQKQLIYNSNPLLYHDNNFAANHLLRIRSMQ